MALLFSHALRHYKEFAIHVRMYIYPMSMPYLPNVHAIAVAIVDADSTQNVGAFEQEAKRSVQPAIEWFLRKFYVDLRDTLSAFKAA